MRQPLSIRGPLLLTGLMILLMGGCGSAGGIRPLSPSEVVRAYAAAIESGKYAEAYRFMSASFRQRHSLARFKKMIKADPDGARAAMARVRKDAASLRVEAQVSYGNGQRLKLAVEQGQWRIASDPTDLYSQRTPEETLRSFVRALELGRYDILMRFVPRASLKGLSAAKLKKAWEGERKAEIETLIANLKTHLNTPFRRQDDRATMAYGEGFQMKMIREDGAWKVIDPD